MDSRNDHRIAMAAAIAATVLLTTHYLPEAEELCDRIVILNHGEIVARGTPEEIKGDSATLEEAYISLIKGDVQ